MVPIPRSAAKLVALGSMLRQDGMAAACPGAGLVLSLAVELGSIFGWDRGAARPELAMTVAESECALVVCGDSNLSFARGLAVTIYSALTHLGRSSQPVIHVLDCQLPEGAAASLTRVAKRARPDIEIRFVEVDTQRLEALPNGSFFPAASFARLFLHELLADTVRRVVYLDADLLVRRDVSPLFSLDLGGAPLAAVRDVYKPSPDGDPSRPYFNAGVLLIDIPSWRAEGVGNQALAYMESKDRLELPDQDALNAVITDWYRLGYDWNLQLGAVLGGTTPVMPEGWMSRAELTTQRRELQRGPVILHFTVRKPWNASQGPLPGSGRWAVCFAQSGWLTPSQSAIWLCRWYWARARHFLGTARLRLRGTPRSRERS